MKVRFSVFLYIFQKGGMNVIDVTKMNGMVFTVNADLIESVDEVPDTVITLTTGKKIMVQETRTRIKELVMLYKHSIFTGSHLED